MRYLLILLVIAPQSSSLREIEFASEKACLRAAHQIEQDFKTLSPIKVKTTCLDRGLH